MLPEELDASASSELTCVGAVHLTVKSKQASALRDSGRRAAEAMEQQFMAMRQELQELKQQDSPQGALRGSKGSLPSGTLAYCAGSQAGQGFRTEGWCFCNALGFTTCPMNPGSSVQVQVNVGRRCRQAFGRPVGLFQRVKLPILLLGLVWGMPSHEPALGLGCCL